VSDATPLSQLNPKKKIFETIQPGTPCLPPCAFYLAEPPYAGFITLDTREAAWVNPVTKTVHKIRTKDGVCTAPTLVGASLS
jgi:aminoacyl tRNA synthase complex-interacting multifunctional protein 1